MHAMGSVCLDCGSPEADWGGISYGSSSVGSFMLRSWMDLKTVILLLFLRNIAMLILRRKAPRVRVVLFS